LPEGGHPALHYTPRMKTTTVDVTRVTHASRDSAADVVAIEEPLEILVGWHLNGEPREKTVSITMRTPSDDFDLAAGFLFTEGLIRSGADIESIRHWSSPNRVRVGLIPGAAIDTAKLDRHFYTTSSCGVCGKTSIDALQVASARIEESTIPGAALMHALPSVLHGSQAAFHDTGGVHGAALVDLSGKVLCAREDVGRHNAVDKVIGAFVRERQTPLRDRVLIVSSRGSFEIVQKAIVAGIPTVAFVGGPTSLAVDLARRFNVTLVGFVRDGRFTVYSGTIA
jgi:FdhD protein